MSSFKIISSVVLPESEVEIKVEIIAEELTKNRPEAVKILGEQIKIDGFRPGHIPEKILIEKIGEIALLEEAAELTLKDLYGPILAEAKINPIGSPKVSISKLAANNPLEITITVAVVPEVSLPDYKEIAKEIISKKTDASDETSSVSEKEPEDAIEELRKRIAHHDYHENAENNGDKKAIGGDNNEHGEHDHGDLPLPEVDEAFIKKFGEFENIEDFKKAIKENISAEKNTKEKDKKRVLTIEKIIEGTKVILPKILVESETDRMVSQFKTNIKEMGMDPELYMQNTKKTDEDLRAEWKNEAEKRAKIQLVMNQIAINEKIQASEEEIKNEVSHLLSYYKDADPFRASVYIETVLTNEKVWQFLESQK